MTAVKYDTGKPRVDLIPPESLLGAGRALAFGANKYPPRNWEGGLNHGRLYGATLRHLFAFQMGETQDKESGLHPLDHALASLMMLQTSYVRDIGMDDRFYDKMAQHQETTTLDDIKDALEELKKP